MDKAIDILKSYFQADDLLDKEELNRFTDSWSLFTVKRKQLITSQEEREKYLYLVLDGVQRIYHRGVDSKETTLIFTYPHSLGGVADAFLLKNTSKYNYESLTPSSFLRMHHETYDRLIGSSESINHIMKIHTYQAFSGLLHRMVELQSYSSEDKFKALLHRSPHILQLVPHKYIANYLGIDPTNFSKLMNRVKI